jgi:hypothetical protein
MPRGIGWWAANISVRYGLLCCFLLKEKQKRDASIFRGYARFKFGVWKRLNEDLRNWRSVIVIL